MNWLDKSIAWFSPQAGLRRVRARTAAQALLSYEGAKVGRRTDGWFTSGTSANAEIGPALARLRERSQDLVRNNPYAERAINELTAQAIGTGIMAQARTDSDELNRAIDAEWEQWSERCDADGLLDFNGIQDLVLRTMLESGEALVRFRKRSSDDGFRVPFQLQVIDPAFIDTSRNESTEQYTIVNGVEFDLIGRRTFYWLFSNHPGDNGIATQSVNNKSYRVPASEILHVYRKKRPGQVRGVPLFAPVMLAMRDLDEYQDAERVRKKIEACLTAFVTQPEGPDGVTLGGTSTDENGKRIEEFRPGMVMYGKAGEDVKFFAPTAAGGYTEYVRQNERMIAIGVGLTYEQLTGDLSNVNYSSYKAGHLSFQNNIESLRWLCLLPAFLRPVRQRFIDQAFAAGVIPDAAFRAYATEWTPPKFGTVDPLKDAEAAALDLQLGRMTWPQAVAEYGFDPEKQITDIARWKPRLDAAGVIFNPKVTNEQNGNSKAPDSAA